MGECQAQTGAKFAQSLFSAFLQFLLFLEPNFNRPDQLRDHERLFDVVISPQFHTLADVRTVHLPAEEDEGHGGGGGITPELLEDIVAVHARKPDIAKNKIKVVGLGEGQSFRAAESGMGFPLHDTERLANQGNNFR